MTADGDERAPRRRRRSSRRAGPASELATARRSACNAAPTAGYVRYPAAPLLPRVPEPRRSTGGRTPASGRSGATASTTGLRSGASTAALPYNVALVELDAGPRLISNVLGVAPDELSRRRCGSSASRARSAPGRFLVYFARCRTAAEATVDDGRADLDRPRCVADGARVHASTTCRRRRAARDRSSRSSTSLACCVAGSDTDSARWLADWAARRDRRRRRPSIVGTPLRAPAPLAALANGTAAHALDFDDVSMRMIHPSATLVPALLAVGEPRRAERAGAPRGLCRRLRGPGPALPRSSTPSTTTGAGTPRARSAPSAPRWRPAGPCGLDEERSRHALGIAASSSASSIRKNFGSMVKPLHAGQAAFHGLQAAGLAERGFTADRSVLEGTNGFLDVFSSLDRAPRALRAPSPTGAPTSSSSPGSPSSGSPVAARSTPPRTRSSSSSSPTRSRPRTSLASSAASTGSCPNILVHHVTQSGLEGKFSMEYSLAVCLLDGRAGLAQYTRRARSRSRGSCRSWNGSTVVVDDSIPVNLAFFPSVVTVRLGTGAAHGAGRRPEGVPRAPADGCRGGAKARECCAGCPRPRPLRRARVDRVAPRGAYADVATLAALLARRAGVREVWPSTSCIAPRRALVDGLRRRSSRRRPALHPVRQRGRELRQSPSQRASSTPRRLPGVGVERSELVGAHARRTRSSTSSCTSASHSGRGRRAREHRVPRPHARVRPERRWVPGADRRRGVPAGAARVRDLLSTPRDGPRAGRRLHRRRWAGRFAQDRGCCARGASERPRHRPAACSPAVSHNDLHCVVYSSGTTGPSKGIMISNGHALTKAVEVLRICNFTSRRHPVLAASALLLDGPAARRALGRARRVEHRAARPIQCQLLLGRRAGARRDRRALRLQHPEDAGASTRAERRPGQPAALHVQRPARPRLRGALRRQARSRATGSPRPATPSTTVSTSPVVPGSCGRVSDDWEVRLGRCRRRRGAVGETGEILLRPREPASVMLGYLNKPEVTAAAFRDLWFHTGDLARRDETGYYFYQGRNKDVIRRRGQNISAWEVEEILRTHPGVADVAALAQPLGGRRRRPARRARRREEGASLDLAGSPRSASGGCRRSWCPASTSRSHELPKTPSGRVEKYKLERARAAAPRPRLRRRRRGGRCTRPSAVDRCEPLRRRLEDPVLLAAVGALGTGSASTSTASRLSSAAT